MTPRLVGAIILLAGLTPTLTAQERQSPLIGRWDLTVHGSEGDYPSWLEVRLSGYRTLVGSFVGHFGSARPVSKVEFDHGRLKFTVPPQWERRPEDITFTGTLEGDILRGDTTDDAGKRVAWEGCRAPAPLR